MGMMTLIQHMRKYANEHPSNEVYDGCDNVTNNNCRKIAGSNDVFYIFDWVDALFISLS